MSLTYVDGVTASMGVTNLGEAVDWYNRVLGFTLMYQVDEIGWAEMSTHMKGVTVGLSQNQAIVQGGGATNVWSVANIDEAKTHLDAHNVRQDGDIQVIPGLVKLLTFFDPDGNAMMFAEPMQGA